MTTALAPRGEPVHGLLLGASIVAGLKVALLLGESFRTDNLLPFAGWVAYVAYKGDNLLRTLLTLPLFALVLHGIERLRMTGTRRIAAVTAVSLACSLLAAAVMTWALPYPPLAIQVGGSASLEAWFLYSMWANLVIVVLAIVTLDHLRERRRAVERLRTAQDRGRVVRQQLARAQLMAIQARVDPQLLFDMLKAVKGFYQQDTDRAERLLDELAAFLRAALPRLRSPDSPLEIEFELVASYTRMLQIACATPVRFTAEVPAGMADARFPAGLLLPLAIRLIERQQVDRRIGLRASVGEIGPRVSIVAGAMLGDAEAVRLIASLHELYSGGARCVALPESAAVSGETTVLELEVPLDQP